MISDHSAFPLHEGAFPGLTKRELFAAMAMKEFSRNATWDDLTDGAEDLAKCAVAMADALITELSK